jgi:hypothetical protein
MRNLPRRVIAAASVVAVLSSGLSACSLHTGPKAVASATPSAAPSTSAPLGTGNPFVDVRIAAGRLLPVADLLAGGMAKGAKLAGDSTTPAAGLRAKLSYLLTEHVYLAGLTVATSYHFGTDSPEVGVAAASLDTNSTDIADVIGVVAPSDKDSFLQSWRSHINDFGSYATGAKVGGPGGAQIKKDAEASLLAYAKAQGEFFSKITKGGLSAATVAQEFTTHISSLTAAVDAFAAGSANSFKLLKVAADHMAVTAGSLALGIAKSANLTGDPADRAASLRAGLVSLLTGHVYLAGLAVFIAYSMPGATESSAFKAAGDVLDSNSQELATTVGAVAGPEKQAAFLGVWRVGVDDFVSYAKEAAVNNTAGKNAALANLDGNRTATGQSFADLTGGVVTAGELAAALKDHFNGLVGAIDSLKSGVLDVPVAVPTAPAPATSASPDAATSSARPNGAAATPGTGASPSAGPGPSVGATLSVGGETGSKGTKTFSSTRKSTPPATTVPSPDADPLQP